MAVVSLSWVTILLAILSGSGLVLPLGIPPAPEDPVMQQAAPEECLAYATWSGIAAPDPKSPNQTEQLLAEAEMQQFAKEIMQTIDKLVAKQTADAGLQAAELARDAVGWAKTILSHPGALYLANVGRKTDEVRAGAVFHLGADAEKIRKQIEKQLQALPPRAIEKTRVAGLDGYRGVTGPKEPPVALAFKGQYLLVAVGEGEMEALVARLGKKPPQWLTDIAKQLPVARRSMATYVNVRAIREFAIKAVPPQQPSLETILAALGLDRLQTVISVSGMDLDGMVVNTAARFDGALGGLFQLLNLQPLTPDDLAGVPHSAVLAAAARVDFAKALETADQIVGKIDARAGEKFRRGIEQAETQLGLDLHNDLLKPLGSTACFYLPSAGMATGFNATLTITVRDRARLAGAHEKLLVVAQQVLAQSGGSNQPKIEKSEFSGHTLYTVVLPQPGVPVRPSWCLTDKELVIGLLPGCVKDHVLRPRVKDSLAQTPAIKALFAASPAPSKLVYQNVPEAVQLAYPMVQLGLVMLSGKMAQEGLPFDVAALPACNTLVSHLRPNTMTLVRTSAGVEIRSRGTLPFLSPSGPMVMGVAAGLILPAVQTARNTAREMSSMNNMKQLALAALVHESNTRALPAAYTADKQNKPLLSWRVQVLPYLEQDVLYREFHQDEPWDSPHNKTLIARMPPIFLSPDSRVAPGKTRYLAVRGEHTVMPGAKAVKIADVRDGTSNTILFVEAAPESAVVWTRPDDFTPNAEDPFKGLIAAGKPRFAAAFVDGHVQRFSRTLAPKTLKALFTRDGGEVVELPTN